MDRVCNQIFVRQKLNICIADELLLSAPQATFKHGGQTFSNCSLLHKLLITGQGKQVVSRRGELDRDLLSTTCEMDGDTKVSGESD